MIIRIGFLFTLLLGSFAVASFAQGASFDCTKASTKIEEMICSNEELSKLDDELGTIYSKVTDNYWSKEIVPHNQKIWIKERNSCKDIDCLKSSYRRRIKELRSPYQMVMDKEPGLCKTVLDTYNKDMDSYGTIKYDSHEMFSKIEWKSEPSLGLLHATFDINNDGKKELVIETTAGFHGIETDTFYIFPAESNVLTKLKPGSGGLRPLFETQNQFFGGRNNLYQLTGLPPSKEGSISVYFIMHPFTWEGASYISITDVAPRWIAISKYIEAGKLQDVCYFFNGNIKQWDIEDITGH